MHRAAPTKYLTEGATSPPALPARGGGAGSPCQGREGGWGFAPRGIGWKRTPLSPEEPMDSQLAAVSAVTISGAIVCGLVLAFLGSIKLHLSRRLDLGERQVAGLLASLNLALIPMMLLSGVLCDGLGARWVLFGGSLVTAAGLFTMSHSPTYVRALFAVLLIGLGAASANTATVVLMW